mgnify:CR=1 FL=1
MTYIKTFIFGLLGASGALLAELIVSNLYFIFSGQEISLFYFDKVTFFLILVVVIEEIFKYLMLLKSYSPHKQNFLIAVLSFGLGFSLIEIILALLNTPTTENMPSFILPITGVFLLHLTTSGIIGGLIFSKKNTTPLSITITLIAASGLHLLYNLLIIYN